jgi:hypothetical protein
MPRRRKLDTPEDPNRKFVEDKDNPGQQREEVDNAVGTPEVSEAPRPDDGKPFLKIRKDRDNQGGEPLSESKSEPVPSQWQEKSRDPRKNAAELRAFNADNRSEPGKPDKRGVENPEPPNPDNVYRQEAPAGDEPTQDATPAEGADVDDTRSDTDKGLDVGSRVVVPAPNNPGVETELVRSVSKSPFLDTAQESEKIQTGEAEDRVLGVMTEQAEGETKASAEMDERVTAENDSKDAEDAAELTIFNTRPGDEPGREMRDTTLESAAIGYPPAGYSGYVPPESPELKSYNLKLSRVRKLRGEKAPVDLKQKPIRHNELAVRLLEEGYKLLRQSGRGDDASYLRTALNLAVKLSPRLHAKLTGRK